jgi:hypothetical protein
VAPMRVGPSDWIDRGVAHVPLAVARRSITQVRVTLERGLPPQGVEVDMTAEWLVSLTRDVELGLKRPVLAERQELRSQGIAP